MFLCIYVYPKVQKKATECNLKFPNDRNFFPKKPVPVQHNPLRFFWEPVSNHSTNHQDTKIYPHCSAIALAIPSKVFDLSFALSADGGNFQMRCSRPSTMFVGFNLGRLNSHRQVAFVSGWPN